MKKNVILIENDHFSLFFDIYVYTNGVIHEDCLMKRQSAKII